MSDWKTANYLLNTDDMNYNAKLVYSYLIAKGFTENAIFAILGNMWRESTVNPACWESGDVGNEKAGYGLCQWTPATKLFNWLSENGFSDRTNGDYQLEMLVNDAGQWGNSKDPHAPSVSPPFAWSDFFTSNLDIETLTRYFMYYWERPAYDESVNVINERIAHALEFAKLLSGYTPPHPPLENSIWDLICNTSFIQNSVSDSQKTILKSLKIGYSVQIKQTFNHRKSILGYDFFGKRVKIENKTYTINAVKNNGFIVLQFDKNSKHKIYINPNYII